MPFNSLLTAGIETLSNQVLKLDQQSQVRREALAGKVLAIELKPLPKFYFVVSEQQLDVLNQFEGEADCSLSLSLITLAELKNADNIPSLIKQDKLQLEGDIKLAQRFADLFLQLQPDLEEKLSKLVGDAMAYQAGSLLRKLVTTSKGAGSKLPARLHEVAAEEWRVLVVNEEYQHWQQQVAALAKDLAQLEQRVEALQA